MRREALIQVEVMEIVKEKTFIGTEDEVYREAIDFMNQVAMDYIMDNDIEEDEQDLIIEDATHKIIWANDVQTMYAIVENGDALDSVIGIFIARADAEEIILAICDEEVSDLMRSADNAFEVFGRPWKMREDYKYLMLDFARCFDICEVPIFN